MATEIKTNNSKGSGDITAREGSARAAQPTGADAGPEVLCLCCRLLGEDDLGGAGQHEYRPQHD